MPHRGAARAGRNVLNRPNVKTKRNIDVVNRAVFHHGERTFERFFGRLKQNLERTSFDFVREFGSRRQNHGAVGVVTASMNVFDAAVLVFEGKGIHVGAQHHNGTGFFAADNTHDTGFPHATGDLIAQFFECIGQVGPGFEFLHAGFGHTVQFFPNFDDVQFAHFRSFFDGVALCRHAFHSLRVISLTPITVLSVGHST